MSLQKGLIMAKEKFERTKPHTNITLNDVLPFSERDYPGLAHTMLPVAKS